MFKYIADRLFFLYKFFIGLSMLIFLLIKSIFSILLQLISIAFRLLKVIIEFSWLVFVKSINILWLSIIYISSVIMNLFILLMLFFKNLVFILWEVIVFISFSITYLLNMIFFGLKKLFSLEETILPTNYFIKDTFYSFIFHFKKYLDNTRYTLYSTLYNFDSLRLQVIESLHNLYSYIYLKTLKFKIEIALLKGNIQHLYWNIKNIQYVKPNFNLRSIARSKFTNILEGIYFLWNKIKDNYKYYAIVLGKIPLSIMIFIYKILINSIFFIVYDLIKIRSLYVYAKTYKIKSLSLALIIGLNLFAIIFFYNNMDIFKKQSENWQNRLAFHNVSFLIVSIAESELLQSIKYQKIQIEVAPEETLSQILLERYDVDEQNINLVVSKIRSAFNLKIIKPSWVINAVLVSGGAFDKNQVKRISIPISNYYDLVVEADANNEYRAFKQQKKLTRYIFRRRVLISDSFYKSANKVGVPDGVIDNIYKVLSWDVDFQRDVKNGDVLELVYECLYNQLNELTSCDPALYAFLNGAQKSITLYKYADGYYNPDGQSAAKTLIKTPINGARLNSNFGIRTHPVLGYAIFHKGIDFAATTGTPILASGNGVVEKKYYSDTYGNYLKIRHNEFLSSAYAHMNAFNAKVKEGESVKQGQIIGYVGSTGRVTGPHLHYEVLIKGKQINPLILNTPPDKILKDAEQDAFVQYQDMLSKVIIRIPTKGKIISPIYNTNDDTEGGDSSATGGSI